MQGCKELIVFQPVDELYILMTFSQCSRSEWTGWLDKIRCVKLCCISTFVTKSQHCFVKLQRKGHTQYSQFVPPAPNLATELNIFNFISFYVYIALQ